MKSTQTFQAILALSLLACASSHAANWSDKLYLNYDLGAAFIPDTNVRVVHSPLLGIPPGRGVMKNENGIRSDLALGYNLTEHWSVEAEGGVIWSPSPGPSDDDFYQIPIMAKVLYRIPLSQSWKAYVGAGVGETEGFWDAEVAVYPFRTPMNISADDWSFSYEAEAGIKYNLSQHTELGLGYKFLGVNQYVWHTIDLNAAEMGEFAHETITTNPVYTHTVSISFTWKF
ncbi:MAG TPA: porin family protein [Candidatus Angelobacter sp.]|nr:porin family protein [Candidatus Angelobacter sp.]